ncbi:MAG: bifunctional 2-polyprenyl-6-hydroxyphenol methylase/3-demethylubiquinol 3-O-methyltransferase UbiG [Woeseiaceae bacterium]|nr:bifunctional 2-polyprenyl-6-hydroxyphenol methylase/3-demethylubiquinol 3-O-methyltransferase UbiG [Woeseiaceae bacterium]
MTEPQTNVDGAEIAKFDALASRWWDPDGEFRTLHEINPLRIGWIEEQAGLAGLRVLDIGCGGGLLAEGMAAAGAHVTGIDLSERALEVARLHGHESGIRVEYECCSAEDFAAGHPGEFDLVTCLEMLEHVPRPAGIVAAAAQLLRPGGHAIFSTINRNAKSFLFAIVGAEYVLRLLPAGTHDYQKFIRPSELDAWARHSSLSLESGIGLHFNPLTRRYTLAPGLDVNYLMHFSRRGSTR